MLQQELLSSEKHYRSDLVNLLHSRLKVSALLFPLFVLLLALAPHALAFSNGQAAGLAIGESSLTSFNPRATPTNLVSPIAETFDSSGNLWVADQGDNRVLEYPAPFSTGEAATLVIGQTSLTAHGFATGSTGLNAPQGLAFDPNGNLWVVDTSNNRVLEYPAPLSTGEAATVVIGQANFTGSGLATSSTGLNQPESIAFGRDGSLWVADALNDRVLEYPHPFSSGEAATLVLGESNFTTQNDEVSKTGLSTPSGLTFDSSGNLWVADGVRVLEYAPPFSTDEGASLVIGQSSFTDTSTYTTSTGVNLPYAVAFDPSGNLWVSDYGNNRVLEYPAPLSSHEAAAVVIGQADFTSNAATPVFAPTPTGLNHPWGLAFDHSGNLWVADYAEARVLQYAGPSATITTSATGAPETTTTPAPASTTTAPSTATTSSSPSSSGGGVPEFPYQPLMATALTVLLAVSYLLARSRVASKGVWKG